MAKILQQAQKDGMIHGLERKAKEPIYNPYGRAPHETKFIWAGYCTDSLHAAYFKNQVLVITILIGSQKVKKHIEKGILAKFF